MKTKVEIEAEINNVLSDIENVRGDEGLMRHLNSTLDTLLWVMEPTQTEQEGN
jgi:hypothetical protein